MKTSKVSYLGFHRNNEKQIAHLSISDAVVFSSGSVSAIAQEIRRWGIQMVHLESGAFFSVPPGSNAFDIIAQHPSQNDFFIFRLISECNQYSSG